MTGQARRAGKTLISKFEDELGDLVDRYLLDDLDPAAIKRILCYEAEYNYVERLTELRNRGLVVTNGER